MCEQGYKSNPFIIPAVIISLTCMTCTCGVCLVVDKWIDQRAAAKALRPADPHELLRDMAKLVGLNVSCGYWERLLRTKPPKA